MTEHPVVRDEVEGFLVNHRVDDGVESLGDDLLDLLDLPPGDQVRHVLAH